MRLPKIMCQTVTFHTRVQTGEDKYHNPIYDDQDTPVAQCSLQPASAGTNIESQAGGDFTVADAVLYAPPGAPVSYTSAVTLDGRKYEINGDTTPWYDSRGRLHHYEILLKKWTG